MKISGDRRIALSRMLGMALIAAGFIVIGLAWDGMASVACPDCQLPYLLSGGATGLGLIILGVGLVVVGQIYSERERIERRIEMLAETLAKAAGAPAAAANGSAATGGGRTVVAGRSTYHDASCHLVQGKELDAVPIDVARAGGLSACRVCLSDEPAVLS